MESKRSEAGAHSWINVSIAGGREGGSEEQQRRPPEEARVRQVRLRGETAIGFAGKRRLPRPEPEPHDRPDRDPNRPAWSLVRSW